MLICVMSGTVAELSEEPGTFPRLCVILIFLSWSLAKVWQDFVSEFAVDSLTVG